MHFDALYGRNQSAQIHFDRVSKGIETFCSRFLSQTYLLVTFTSLSFLAVL